MMKTTIALILLTLFATAGAAADVAVIANPSVTATSMTKTQLVDIYVGDRKLWDDGKPIVVLDLKPKGTSKDLFYHYLGKSVSRLKSIWMKNLLSGEGHPPESMPSEVELLKKVAETKGAIGYVDKSLVTGNVTTLFVIRTDDK